MKIILKFLRLTPDGHFELVKWCRSKEGQLYVVRISPVRPSPEQAQQVFTDKNQELIL